MRFVSHRFARPLRARGLALPADTADAMGRLGDRAARALRVRQQWLRLLAVICGDEPSGSFARNARAR